MRRSGILLIGLASCGGELQTITPEQEGFAARPTATAPAETVAPPIQSSHPAPTTAKATPSALPSSRMPARPTKPDDDDDDPRVDEQGPLTETQRSVFRAVGLCLHKEKEADRKGGSLAVELTLDEKGKVTQVDLGPGYSPTAKACVEPRLRAIQFPPQPNGGLRVMKYPINEVPDE